MCMCASDILPEMVKGGGPALIGALLDLVCTVWESEAVPQEWVCSNLVPIPKKGNLAKCDNWRGIALLEVVGKVVAAMIQRRLQSLAETILPDSQCGFRKGRSCTDMVFAVRQVAEKLYEHRCKGFLVFVDLRKAYDSVGRQCLWIILKKAGVPERLINIIRGSFHTNMTATLKIPGVDAPPIEVRNGLRQGCCMAPVLFNLLMWAVFQQWHRAVADIPGVGIPVATNPGGSLLFSRKSTDKSKVHRECQFADDSALLATTHDGAQRALDQFIHVAYSFGLTVNLDKTKVMAAGYGLTEADRLPLDVAGEVVECVDSFRYLGSLLHTNGRSTPDISSRIAGASRAFGALRQPVFTDSNLSLATKRLVYGACVLSLLLYCAECWVPLKPDLDALCSFHSSLHLFRDGYQPAECLGRTTDQG
eukprot:scpid69812/ scgid35385/ LINE-1 reverse transcriptase homolog